jgi:lipoprotein-releasing system ATP-binding protein
MNRTLISAKSISKNYYMGTQKLEILKSIDLDVFEGDSLCISGSSGAGKSTLLHILGSLDKPSTGELYFDHKDLLKKNDEDLASFRSSNLGFVFQFHHLLKEFSALENVMMPARIAGHSAKNARKMALEILQMVGLSDRLQHFPSELSGGEQQRVAVARALVLRPKLVMADEPTGNLDTTNSKIVQDLFFKLKADFNLTLVVVTHDKAFASRFPRNIEIRDGQIAGPKGAFMR